MSSSPAAAAAAAPKNYKRQNVALGERYAELSCDAHNYRSHSMNVIDIDGDLRAAVAASAAAGAAGAARAPEVRAIFGVHYKLSEKEPVYLRLGRYSAHKLTVVCGTPIVLASVPDAGPMPTAQLVLPLADSLLHVAGVDTKKMAPEDFLVNFGVVANGEVISPRRLQAYSDRANSWVAGLRRAFPLSTGSASSPMAWSLPRTVDDDLRQVDFPWNSLSRSRLSAARIAAFAAQRQKAVEDRMKREEDEQESSESSGASDSEDVEVLRACLERAKSLDRQGAGNSDIIKELKRILVGEKASTKRAGKTRVKQQRGAKRGRDSAPAAAGAANDDASAGRRPPAKHARRPAAPACKSSVSPSTGASSAPLSPFDREVFHDARSVADHEGDDDETDASDSSDDQPRPQRLLNDDDEERNFQIAMRLSRGDHVSADEDGLCRYCKDSPAVVVQDCDSTKKNPALPFHKTLCVRCWNEPKLNQLHQRCLDCQTPATRAFRIENDRVLEMDM